MLYKNTKVKVRSLDGDKDFFDIVTGVQQGDTFAPYLFIICLDNILWALIDLIKENGLILEKARSRRSLAQTITDMDYTDDKALQANTPTLAEFLLHSLEWAAGSIGLLVNADKMEHICFNQSDDITTINGGSPKLMDMFIYLRSSISSTENDINMQLVKAWTAIDRLSVTWKSDLSYKINRNFFQVAVMSILLHGCIIWTLTNTTVWMHHLDTDKAYREKAWQQLHKDATSCIKQILEVTSHKTAAVWPPTNYLKEHPN